MFSCLSFFFILEKKEQRGAGLGIKYYKEIKKWVFPLVLVEKFSLTARVYQQGFCGGTVMNLLNREE